MSHDRVDKLKPVIKYYFSQAPYGLFDCRCVFGDSTVTIYKVQGIRVDICLDWYYFEVFGLSDAEFAELASYYRELKAEYDKQIINSILEESS